MPILSHASGARTACRMVDNESHHRSRLRRSDAVCRGSGHSPRRNNRTTTPSRRYRSDVGQHLRHAAGCLRFGSSLQSRQSISEILDGRSCRRSRCSGRGHRPHRGILSSSLFPGANTRSGFLRLSGILGRPLGPGGLCCPVHKGLVGPVGSEGERMTPSSQA